MRIRAFATWNPRKLAPLGIPKGKGFLFLQVKEDFRAKMGEELLRLSKVQDERFKKALEKWNSSPVEFRGPQPEYESFLVDLEVDVNIYYKRRNLDQNALLWSLYTLEANWANNTPDYRNGYLSKGLPSHIITPQEIHDSDCEDYSEKFEFFVPADSLSGFCRGVEFEVGKVKSKEPITQGTYKVIVWKTTSYLDTKQFATWTQRVIDRIRDGGLLKVDEGEFLILKQNFLEMTAGKK